MGTDYLYDSYKQMLIRIVGSMNGSKKKAEELALEIVASKKPMSDKRIG